MTERRGAHMDMPWRAASPRRLAWAFALVVLGGYVAWQLVALATVKDSAPPASVISVPEGATINGESRVERQPYRTTTHVTVRASNGREPHQLLEEMGLPEQPTQIGPSLLDWRPVWVYSTPSSDGVELRLVYLRDSLDVIAP